MEQHRTPASRHQTHRHQNEPNRGTEVPGDTDAPDIVGRTGEEMPDAPDAQPDGAPRENRRGREDGVTG